MKNEKTQKFLFEVRDLLAGAAFPFMLMVIISAAFIVMVPAITGDKVLMIVMLVIGEALLGVALTIFGKQSGVTSVRRLVQHAKKNAIGTSDKLSLLNVGEYSAYKGFLMGFICCIPFIIFQLIQCLAPNTFTDFMLQYVFSCLSVFPYSAEAVSPWFNFLFVLYPVAVHGIAYIVSAHVEWGKQQKVAELQNMGQGSGDGK